ncbi:killer cell lectin-like receptor subfamily B member 1B allele A [Tachyglossus aculeatus]|uniref:killer cell lectin-like receptor subfamily B member 1B allele A n=1 Tax=Tachyglossus aculeatus TaxID=9261 RepID=UPI0018F47A4D|nr:killer cell lectin-like receptor subfamily B member 1B allele A [Tachyglossus aculeatus]
MSGETVYADIKFARKKTSSSSPQAQTQTQDSHQSPEGHVTALKVACVVIILLLVAVIALSAFAINQMKVISPHSSRNDTENSDKISSCPGSTVSTIPTTATTTIPKTCKDDWKMHKGKCYWISNNTEKKTWNESKENCADKQSNLTMIKDMCDLGFLWSQIPSSSYYWTGLHIPSPGSNWTWPDGSSLDWSLFQVKPSGDKETCAALSKDGIYPENCGGINLWICEK